jgi:hypothetical protein
MYLNKAVEDELRRNGNKLSKDFIDRVAYTATVVHHQMTPNTRVCVVTLPSGHDLVGYAQVLDAKNDVELIGQEVAYKNAVEQLWSVCGNIAKDLL